jgi:hypothetical protein
MMHRIDDESRHFRTAHRRITPNEGGEGKAGLAVSRQTERSPVRRDA